MYYFQGTNEYVTEIWNLYYLCELTSHNYHTKVLLFEVNVLSNMQFLILMWAKLKSKAIRK